MMRRHSDNAKVAWSKRPYCLACQKRHPQRPEEVPLCCFCRSRDRRLKNRAMVVALYVVVFDKLDHQVSDCLLSWDKRSKKYLATIKSSLTKNALIMMSADQFYILGWAGLKDKKDET